MADFHFSVFAGGGGAEAGASPFPGLLDDALRRAGSADRWQASDDGRFWCHVQPVDGACPAQGWKLHVSATPASAAAVLERSLPVLLAGGAAFKFARTPEHVAQLNARHTPRGHSGKFLTVYPRTDEEAVRLAAALHEATPGLPGPRVLSDRPYAPDSLVHYRYGAFVEQRRISNDGLQTWVLLDPDGNPVEDRRVGWYLPPAWARCPFPEPVPAAGPRRTGRGDGVLLGGRFLVREAVRHMNKGGVYHAVDTQTGAEAIVKEARPHVAVDAAGQDVRDLLRAEARALEALGPSGLAPRLLAQFEQAGHVFIAEERVPGVVLRQWVLDRIRGGGWRRDVPGALDMAGRLARLMEVAHRSGLVLRDFTPNNVVVRPDGELRLIDLELAVARGEEEGVAGGAGTPGYGAPEQMAGARPSVEADHHGLGACICFVLTGSTPDLLPESPDPRPLRARLAEWLDVRGASDLPPAVRDLVLGLMDPDPALRPTAADAREVLAEVSRPGARTTPPATTSPATTPPATTSPARTARDEAGDTGDPRDEEGLEPLVDDVVGGIVTHLLDTMDPTDDDRLWPVSCAQGSPDPCIVQLGAAGVLGVLTRCADLTGDPRLPEAVGTAARWTADRVGARDERPPGLYFGRAGIAWALYEAGRAIEDERLAACGLELAAALPAASPNPDITHGTAGIGMALLHLGRRAGREDLLRRAGESADVLVETAEDGPDGLIWGTPAAYESRLAGGRYHGFAHGTAGVAAFLLATGRPDCVDLAR